MRNSVKPMAELSTFKLRNFRNSVNDLRENYWLIFSSIVEKVTSSVYIEFLRYSCMTAQIRHRDQSVGNYIFVATLLCSNIRCQ